MLVASNAIKSSIQAALKAGLCVSFWGEKINVTTKKVPDHNIVTVCTSSVNSFNSFKHNEMELEVFINNLDEALKVDKFELELHEPMV